MTDATNRAKQLLSTLDRENAVAFSSIRGVLKECIEEIERLRECYEGEIENRLNIARSHDKQTQEIERLRAALEPFAKAHEAMSEPNLIIDPYEHITLHDLRVAHEALGKDDE